MRHKNRGTRRVQVVPQDGTQVLTIHLAKSKVRQLVEGAVISASDEALTDMVWSNPDQTVIHVGAAKKQQTQDEEE